MNSYIVVLLPAFLLGLSGGFGHCSAMCSPFVLYISSRFPASGYTMLVPQIKYNLGRITTYMLLGGLLGGLGSLEVFNDWLMLQKVLTVAAGGLLVLFALSNIFKFKFKLTFFHSLSGLYQGRSAYVTGVVLGFLPCGLVMGALIMAAVSTNAVVGAVAMGLFGIGTSVALLLIAVFGGFLLRYMPLAKVLFTVLLLLSGSYFIYAGLRL